MGIVGMNGLFRGHVKCHALAFHAPCVAAVPALVLVTIGFGVLEIPVLHQFGIQSAVGCIIQVFKEHANQVLTDGLRPAFVHGNPRTDRLQSGKPGRVVLGTLAPQSIEGGTVYAVPFQAFHNAVWHFQCKSRDSLVAHLHGVCHWHTSVFHLMARFLVRHEKLLRLPSYQVCRGRTARCAAVRSQVPKAMPPPVCPVLYQSRTVHMFPWAEIAFQEHHASGHVVPLLAIRAQHELHAAPPVVVHRRIRKDIHGVRLGRPRKDNKKIGQSNT